MLEILEHRRSHLKHISVFLRWCYRKTIGWNHVVSFPTHHLDWYQEWGGRSNPGGEQAEAQPGSTRAGRGMEPLAAEHRGDGEQSPWDTCCGYKGTGLPQKAGAGSLKIPPPAGLSCCQGQGCCQALSAVAESCLREGWNCITCLSYQWKPLTNPCLPWWASGWASKEFSAKTRGLGSNAPPPVFSQSKVLVGLFPWEFLPEGYVCLEKREKEIPTSSKAVF